MATTKYIDWSVSSSGDGNSLLTAYKTVLEGITNTVSNINSIIYIVNGSYDESLTLDKSVQIIGYGLGNSTITNINSPMTILESTVNCTFVRITFTCTGSAPSFYMNTPSSFVTRQQNFQFSACRFESQYTGSILVVNGENIVITLCEFVNNNNNMRYIQANCIKKLKVDRCYSINPTLGDLMLDFIVFNGTTQGALCDLIEIINNNFVATGSISIAKCSILKYITHTSYFTYKATIDIHNNIFDFTRDDNTSCLLKFDVSYTSIGEMKNWLERNNKIYNNKVRNMKDYVVNYCSTNSTDTSWAIYDDGYFFNIYSNVTLSTPSYNVQPYSPNDNEKIWSYSIRPSYTQRLNYLYKVETDYFNVKYKQEYVNIIELSYVDFISKITTLFNTKYLSSLDINVKLLDITKNSVNYVYNGLFKLENMKPENYVADIFSLNKIIKDYHNNLPNNIKITGVIILNLIILN